MTAELLPFWPDDRDLTSCIKTVAEASSEAVALAVHQPMSFEVRAVSAEGSRAISVCDERELLAAFKTDNLPEGRLILLISGDTGVGKSHVIRWLDAQLNKAQERGRRLVIRISKGMSLKDILRLILDKTPEHGLEKYRRQIESASDALDPLRAAGQLCEDLAQTLQERFEQAQQRLVEDPSDRIAREAESLCRSDKLPTLLRSQYLRDAHFIAGTGADAGPVRRLIEHLTEAREPSDDDDRKRQFSDSDLRIADRVDLRQLGPAERSAVVDLQREDRRRIALRILNETLDEATTRLTGADPAVGELFDAVRRDLLRADKELVLLIEDFAALVGLQRPLLEIVIKDAIRDGRRELCTMRTALAYTAGYSYMPDTVRTRAGLEYVIPNVPGDEEAIFGKIERHVGAYLNAARLGQERLESTYGQHALLNDNPDWVPRFEARLEPEDAATLAAFGMSADGYALFPFNRAAIRELARETATHEGRVSYNPRSVNQHIIRYVLQRRDDFVRAEFPPSRFGSITLSASVTTQIEQRVPRSEVQRYLRFITYWCGRPDDLGQLARVPGELFAAFGLERVPFADLRDTNVAPTPAQRAPEVQPQQPATNDGVPVPGGPPPVRPSDPVLEQWRSGVAMPQAKARELRKVIAGALSRAVVWDWHLFRPQKGAKLEDWREHVFIPNAPGNEGRTAETCVVAACSEEDLADEVRSAQVTATLSAVQRLCDENRGSLDYEGADDDFPRYAAFVSARVQSATAWVMARPLRAEWDPVPATVQVLLIGARALGVTGSDDDRNTGALINALFASAVAPDRPSSASSPTSGATATGVLPLLEKLASCRGRDISDPESLRYLLLELIAARQGQATKVHAIDAVPVKAAIDGLTPTWELTAEVPGRVTGAPSLERVKGTLTELRRLMSVLDSESQRLSSWCREMEGWLGESFDKDLIVGTLRETAELIKNQGLAGGVSVAGVTRLIEDLRAAPIKAVLGAVAALDGPRSRGALLSVLGKRMDGVVALGDNLRAQYGELLRAAAHELRVGSEAIGADPIGEAASAVVAECERAERLIKDLQP